MIDVSEGRITLVLIRSLAQLCVPSSIYQPFTLIELLANMFTHSGIFNFVVGIVFLPLRNLLAHLGDSDKPREIVQEGRVFYVFTSVLVICGIVLGRMYRP